MITRKGFCWILVPLAFLYAFNCTKNGLCAERGGNAKATVTMTSAAFPAGGMIPVEYTCDGRNISPRVSWDGVPEGAGSLAIICDDPDAPVGTWVHWVLFNVPATVNELPKGIPPDEVLENGARQGMNDFRKFGYGGPCPPGGTHRYYFKIYALDTKLTQGPGITKAELLKAMKGHILAQGQLMGRYKR